MGGGLINFLRALQVNQALQSKSAYSRKQLNLNGELCHLSFLISTPLSSSMLALKTRSPVAARDVGLGVELLRCPPTSGRWCHLTCRSLESPYSQRACQNSQCQLLTSQLPDKVMPGGADKPGHKIEDLKVRCPWVLLNSPTYSRRHRKSMCYSGNNRTPSRPLEAGGEG